ncbi:isoprenylcysteine carboxylmethyltransferase family protein [Chitinophaga sp. CF418]|uniref:methyltransferase family protein n=1 Tax=Chitinophaga sp. CF418 TaxID=1855287 RepID=UPI00092250E3|nr:isoprenylcysteine carboxylmethyltransferase family protein [Chitinophaga sp. CF418]SHM46115.1 Protein-S-isoprenylcysteine O-methyltransferase Ste14 [Chitinophaga sp. CF418]
MHPNLHLFIAVIWVTSEILLSRLLRSSQSDKTRADKQSLRIIWITIMIALPLAHFLSWQLSWPISTSALVPDIGLGLIVAGMLFRFTAIYTLGRYFTVDVAIRADHKIVKSGMYRYLRHPSYLGMLISFFGNALAFNSWIAVLIGFLPVLGAVLYRMKIEEELLISNFGQEYLDYKKGTWRLIPFVY